MHNLINADAFSPVVREDSQDYIQGDAYNHWTARNMTFVSVDENGVSYLV